MGLVWWEVTGRFFEALIGGGWLTLRILRGCQNWKNFPYIQREERSYDLINTHSGLRGTKRDREEQSDDLITIPRGLGGNTNAGWYWRTKKEVSGAASEASEVANVASEVANVASEVNQS